LVFVSFLVVQIGTLTHYHIGSLSYWLIVQIDSLTHWYIDSLFKLLKLLKL